MNLYEVKKNKKSSILDFVDSRFRDQRTSMSELYRSWMLNLAWIRGYQNVDYDAKQRTYRQTNVKNPWRVRLISNMMLPVVRRLISATTHTNPVWECLPATPDEIDIQIAQKATKILQNSWVRLCMPKTLVRLLHWQSATASAFLKIGWDSDKGDEIKINSQSVEEQEARQYLEFAGIEKLPDEIVVNQGEEFIDVVSPFNITVDTNLSIFEDAEWIIESQLRTKDWVVDKYGSKWDKLTESSETDLFVYPFIHSREQNASKIPRKGVLVHELFIKATSKYKEGLHCIIAGGEFLITPQKNPYDHGELPYSHFVEIYDPASFWGTCSAEQIRPNQARYNKVSSSILEQINQMSNLQWLVPNQAGNVTITNRPGGVLKFNYPFAPTQVDLKPIPSYVERFLDRTRADMQDTTSTHDVSEAKNEPGLRSGRAVLALQDADDAILGPTLLWFDESLARTGRLLLQTIIQHVDNERIIEVQGDFGQLESVSFTGEDLLGKSKSGNYWKVRVKTFGRQAMSRSAREQTVRSLLELGLVNPVQHRNELLHILNVADTLTMFEKNEADRTKQYKEILMIIQQGQQGQQGQQPPTVQVYPGQNHIVHIEVIEKFISSNQWEQLPEPIKLQIVDHRAKHIQQQVNEQIYPQMYAANFGASLNAESNQGQTTERPRK